MVQQESLCVWLKQEVYQIKSDTGEATIKTSVTQLHHNIVNLSKFVNKPLLSFL